MIISSEFLNEMVELEKAINKAHKRAETEFQHFGESRGYGSAECTEWYNIMLLLEAMTKMKCTIHVTTEPF